MGGQVHGGIERERRKWLAGRERELSRLATKQYGVVSRRQLIAGGLTDRMIDRRLESGRLHSLHRGVYAVGHQTLTVRSSWMAGVLSCGEGAVLSHRSAAALWGLIRPRGREIDVLAQMGQARRGKRSGGLRVRTVGLAPEDREIVAGIPVTSLARTLLDLADVVDERTLERAFEEADRLGLLELKAVEEACGRGRDGGD